MLYVGEDTLDFSNTKLIEFAQLAMAGDEWQPNSIIQQGYHRANVIPVSLGKLTDGEPFKVYWSVVQNCVLKKGGQRLSEFRVDSYASREIEILVEISLIIKDGIDGAIEDKMLAVFKSYDYPASGDVDVFISNAIASDPSLQLGFFGLLKGCRVIAAGDVEVNQSGLEFVRKQADQEGDENTKYSVEVTSEISLNLMAKKPTNYTEFGDPEKAVAAAVASDFPADDCANQGIYSTEIGRTDWLPDFRTLWGWWLSKIGCVILHLWYPRLQLRNRDLVAEIYITYPKAFSFVDSLTEAAETSITPSVKVPVFSDHAASETAFQALVADKVHIKFKTPIPCVSAGVIVDARWDGDWYDA